MNSRTCVIAVVAMNCLAGAPGYAQSSRTPRTGVIDEAGAIDAPWEQKINAVLLELEQKDLAMFRVLIVSTTGGVSDYSYTIEKAREWALGTRGKDNGLLLMVAVKDRRYRFVTGDGLEAAVPDLFTDTVGKNYLEPDFRRGNYGEGVYQGVVAVAQRIAADAGVELGVVPGETSPPRRDRNAYGGVPSGIGSGSACCCVPLVPLLIFIMIVAALSSRRGRHYRTWGGGGLWQWVAIGTLLNNMGGRGGRSGWSGGWGGFGGGGGGSGGGGFGGGFGGSFGGGGSGGSW